MPYPCDDVGNRHHRRYVGRAVGSRGGAYADEVNVGLVVAGLDLGGESKVPCALVSTNEVGQPRLVDGDHAVFELFDASLVDVDD